MNRNTPLRILFLATFFPKPDNPVMGVWALGQAQALARRGVQVHVISFTSWIPRAVGRLPIGAGVIPRLRAWALCPPVHEWDGLRARYPRWPHYHNGPHARWAFRHPTPPLRIAWPAARPVLDRAVSEIRPHVVHAHGTAVSGFLGYQLQRRHGVPYLTFDADVAEIAAAEKFAGRRRLYEQVGTHAFAMTTVSDQLAGRLRTLLPGVRTGVVRTVADGVPDAAWNVPRPPDLRDRVLVVGAGIMVERKAFPALVRAFALVADRHPQAQLRIVGDGPEKPAVEQAIRECGVAHRVELLGLQSNATVLQELVWADIFALVGRDEPFATVFSEAMAAQTPVIAADDGGIGEVLEDGVQGLLVPPGHVESIAAALDHLLGDPGARARMSKAAGRLADARLNWDEEVTGLVGLLQEAAATR